MSTSPLTPDTTSGDTIVFLHGGNMGGASWEEVAAHLPGRHLLTPDLPGYHTRAKEGDWPGLPAAADDIADLIRSEAREGRAHVVGLSLGGFTALHLASRHPELVQSLLISGVAHRGYPALHRVFLTPQAALWGDAGTGPWCHSRSDCPRRIGATSWTCRWQRRPPPTAAWCATSSTAPR